MIPARAGRDDESPGNHQVTSPAVPIRLPFRQRR